MKWHVGVWCTTSATSNIVPSHNLFPHTSKYQFNMQDSLKLCDKTHSLSETLYKVCSWRLQYNHQVHRDFLITLYIITLKSTSLCVSCQKTYL